MAAPARVMAVVKADAYGHGLERVARALDAEAEAFAVAALGDGLRLRAAGHRQRIVVLSGPDQAGDIAEMQRLGLDAAIHHEAQLPWLAEASPRRGRLRVWIKIDSGMHRLGFAPERVAAVHARLAAMPAIDPEIGLLTHFAESEVFGGAVTRAQIARFRGGHRAACRAAFAGQFGRRARLARGARRLGAHGWPAVRPVGGRGQERQRFRLPSGDDPVDPADRDQPDRQGRAHRLQRHLDRAPRTCRSAWRRSAMATVIRAARWPARRCWWAIGGCR